MYEKESDRCKSDARITGIAYTTASILDGFGVVSFGASRDPGQPIFKVDPAVYNPQ